MGMSRLKQVVDLKKVLNTLNDLTEIEVKIINKVDKVVKVYQGEYVGCALPEGRDDKAELTFRLGKLLSKSDVKPYKKNKPGDRIVL